MEQRLAELVQTVGQLTQLVQQQQAVITNLQGATATSGSHGVVDTRVLERPDNFKGEDAAWKDWSI
eukprot:11176242-Karenia_brevis.AAC.1